jgi:condensin complex subunit 1
VAEFAEASVKRHGDTRLVASLLRELGAVDPAEYKRQAAADAVGVRNVGSLLVELAERLPLTVGKNISLLRPHLDGEAHTLRSALLSVIGHLIIGFSDAPGGGAAGDVAPAAAQLRVHAKDGFLDALGSRTHDVNAFTRARALGVWASLAERKVIPLSHFNGVAEAVLGRLSDTKAVVRKAACGALRVLLEQNPFVPDLSPAPLEATLAAWSARLEAAQAREAEEEAAAAASAAAAVTAAEEKAATPVKAPRPEGEGAEDDDVEPQAPPAPPTPQSEAAALAAEEAAAAVRPFFVPIISLAHSLILTCFSPVLSPVLSRTERC